MSRTTVIILLAILLAVPGGWVVAAEEGGDVTIEERTDEAIKTLIAEDSIYVGPKGRKAAMEFLAGVPRVAAAPLLDALEQSQDVRARLWLLLCINGFEDMSVFEAGADKIIGLLSDAGIGTKYWAIKTLAKMKLRAAVRPLTELLALQDHLLRAAAAVALGQIGADAPVQDLIKLLDDPEWMVRRSAAEALGELKAPGAKARLIEALSDDDLVVQRAAVEALEKLTGNSFNIDAREWSPIAGERDAKIKDWIEKNK